jgi:TRAP-type C4-dicarboxylate transport system substrate-binding protein
VYSAKRPSALTQKERKMKKAIGLGSILVLLICAAHAFAAEPVRLKMASFVSPKSVTNSVTVPEFIKAVEEASEGTLIIPEEPSAQVPKPS